VAYSTPLAAVRTILRADQRRKKSLMLNMKLADRYFECKQEYIDSLKRVEKPDERILR
jgi:hypothetical protein